MKLKQKIISVVSAMACAVSFCAGAMTGSAVSYSQQMKYDDYLYYKQVDEDSDGAFDYVAISYCNNSAKEIIIPNEIDGNPVKSIESKAFSECTSLESIEIPNSVTSIGNSAFSSCTSLESVEIPNSVTSIGNSAFSGCSSLESIEIPNSVRTIRSYTFSNCTSLVNIEIPYSVNSIENNVFSNCTSFEKINVSESNKYYSSVDGVLFNKAKTILIEYTIGNKTKNYKVPEGVTYIGDYAFSRCASLESIEIPNSVVSIGYAAFYNCTSLTDLKIPDSIVKIGELVFADCTSLKSIEIPNSVRAIETGAFGSCRNLESIKIPDSVVSIGDSAFWSCSSLTKIEIPKSVTLIGVAAFDYCENLTICGIEGSYAQEYADKNEIIFVELEEPVVTTPAITTAITTTSTEATTIITETTTIITETTTTATEATTTTEAITAVGKCADVNMDRKVDVRDLCLLYKYFIATIQLECPLEVSDVNGDGQVSIADHALLMKYLLYKDVRIGRNIFDESYIDDRKELTFLPSINPKGEQLVLSSASGLPGETVTLYISINNNNAFECADFGILWNDKNLKLNDMEEYCYYKDNTFNSDCCLGFGKDLADNYVRCLAYNINDNAFNDGVIAAIDFTIPQNAVPGTAYNIDFSDINTFVGGDESDIADSVGISGGTIKVLGEESIEIPGDANGDGETTIADIVEVQKYLTNFKTITKEISKQLDLNSDGRFNVFDLIILKRQIINAAK